ncbi:MAG: hypothetical protein AB2L24_16760 [Mangrovibacterium sp.]
MPLSERRKILPRWEDENQSFIRYSHLFRIIEVEIFDVLDQLNLNTLDLFSNDIKDNKRTMNILRIWQKGLCVDPPSATDKKPLVIHDGRHRILAAHFLGAKFIPIKLYNEVR